MIRLAEIAMPRGVRGKRLLDCIASYERDILLHEEVAAVLPEIERRLEAKQSYQDIARILGIRPEQVRNIIRTRALTGHGRGHGAKHQAIEALLPGVVARVRDGETVADVARDLGMQPYQVERAMRYRGFHLENLGLKRRGGLHARSTELAGLADDMRRLVASGMNNAQIAEQLGHGLTRSRVAFLLHKYKIHRTKGRGARKCYQEDENGQDAGD